MSKPKAPDDIWIDPQDEGGTVIHYVRADAIADEWDELKMNAICDYDLIQDLRVVLRNATNQGINCEYCHGYICTPECEWDIALHDVKARADKRLLTVSKMEITQEQENADDLNTINDGCGSMWSAWCPECGKKSMFIVRPGKVQCNNCG